ncbi:MAG: hypothetical protein KA146_01630 [Leptospiraceae bacterium]|nr:hypothetical protein [Leptospiraceae bacterium]
MGAYKNQDFDFVFRTQQLLKQYEIIKNGNNKEGYEFTLLMNCFVGLLIIPQQINERNRSEGLSPAEILSATDIVDESNFGINPDHIKISVGFGNQNDKTIRNVVRHFRHSVAHSRFEVKSQYEKISSIIFRDENSAGNPTFELELSIENVLKFALKISDCFLEAMSNAEGSTNFHYYKEQENDFKFQEIRRMEIR